MRVRTDPGQEPDAKKRVHLPWATSASNPVRHVQRVVAKIPDAAGLPQEITFTSFRHGGHTDAADAGLTDAQIRALSGHKTAAMVSVYAKKTREQRLAAARKRLEARRTKGGICRNEPLTFCRNGSALVR